MVIDTPFFTISARLLIILLVFLAAIWGLSAAARRTTHRLENSLADREQLARLKTFIQVSRSVLFIVLFIIILLMLLHTLGIDIVPVLTGAGIAGLALSLGAQTLIKDYISGILILVDGLFKIGDTITVGNFSGEVERITLRTTFLRDLDGRLHALPNGDIRALSNLTTGWARAVVDLNLAFGADVEKALLALQFSMQRLKEDPQVAPLLLDAPQVSGWSGLKDWAVQVRIMVKTRPGKQWEVAMAVRRTAIETLKSEGIAIEVPHQTVEFYNQDSSTPQRKDKS